MERQPGESRSWSKASTLWIVLAIVGIAGLFLVPRLVEAWAKQPRAGPAPERVAMEPLAVLAPGGERIGTLSIRYPRSLRVNEDGVIEARYLRGDWAWAKLYGKPVELSLSLSSGRLALAPDPLSYRFDNATIRTQGADSRTWTISPKSEGDQLLLVRLDSAPEGFKTVALSANDEVLGEKHEVALPVKIYTQFNVPQATIDILKTIGALLSFLLTLPAAAMLLQRFRKQPA